MREIKCKNCGSASFRREGDFWICEHCGSRYLPEDKSDKERKEKFSKKDRRNYDFSSVKPRFLDKNEIKDKKWNELYSDYEPWITLEYRSYCHARKRILENSEKIH